MLVFATLIQEEKLTSVLDDQKGIQWIFDWNLRSLLVVTMLHSRLEAFSITIMLRVANQLISISTIWNCSYTVANLPMLEISAIIKEFRSRHLSVLTKVSIILTIIKYNLCVQ
ncbi:hypothetical protein HanRHA438_Chr05g0223541 [Helianthus annuus]|uniref:Uncharacterized protein n=1 Tax=Helianthus annuus TaxID=4232 RepID=A0A9K3IZM8_HELAN|nr:hypothetical protein HanXRQr2_Chr05g0214221 [Helianthus annuus]KAJ0570192.1 hypothetical protein HanHA300_Chr05g0175291 [Helianthus annuus]KAJ0576972.1 hypothetical protein HanIR_Chr05g0230521 [Helianthus annuus]KAJ0584538.1 hypothetical protein HanHA89_Chr05g0189751 [Helianthus annuus]KAJ0747151.1 hypothetical protein HanOQP8_Chr05g0186181 [Helianthus annuus]